MLVKKIESNAQPQKPTTNKDSSNAQPQKPTTSKTTADKPHRSRKPEVVKYAPESIEEITTKEVDRANEKELEVKIKKNCRKAMPRTVVDYEIERIEEGIQERQNKIEQLKAQIKGMNGECETMYREITRLNKIRAMVNFVRQPYQWHVIKRGPSEYYKTEWSEEYTLTTSTMKLSLTIAESSNAKLKKPYHVSVSGTRTTPAVNEIELGRVDYNYIHNKYMVGKYIVEEMRYQWTPKPEYADVALDKDFSDSDAAREFLESWKVRLMADHKEEIEKELAMYREYKDYKIE